MNQKQLEPVISALTLLQQEVPKNLQEKLSVTLKLLQNNEEFSIMRSKVLAELEELGEQNNIESYTRMQLLNVVSLLEGL